MANNTIKIKGLKVQVLPDEAEAYNYSISKEEALKLLTENDQLPFKIMCKEKVTEWRTWSPLDRTAIDEIPTYQTFEISK